MRTHALALPLPRTVPCWTLAWLIHPMFRSLVISHPLGGLLWHFYLKCHCSSSLHAQQQIRPHLLRLNLSATSNPRQDWTSRFLSLLWPFTGLQSVCSARLQFLKDENKAGIGQCSPNYLAYSSRLLSESLPLQGKAVQSLRRKRLCCCVRGCASFLGQSHSFPLREKVWMQC